MTSRESAISSKLSVPEAAAIAIAAASVLGLGIWYSLGLDLWIDEAYTMHTTSQSLAYAIEQALHVEENPPLYFALAWVLHRFSDSVHVVRLLSTLASVAAIVVAAPLAKRLATRLGASPFALWLVASPVLTYFASDARLYALEILATAAILASYWRSFATARSSLRSEAVFVVFAVIGFYTAYYVAFVLASLAIVTLLTSGWRQFRRYLGAMAVVVVLSLPLLVAIARSASHFADLQSGSVTLFASLRATVVHVMQNATVGPGEFAAAHAIEVASLAALLAFVTIAAATRSLDRVALGAILLPWFVTAILVVATFVEHIVPAQRHVVVVFVPMLLAVYVTIDRLPPVSRRVALAVWSLIVVVSSLMGLSEQGRRISPGQWRSVAAYVSERGTAAEPIYVFLGDDALALRYYYRGTAPVIPIPRGPSFERYDLRDYEIRNRAELAPFFSRIGIGGRFWIVTAPCSDDARRFGCDVLESYLAGRFRLVDRHDFFGRILREYAAPAGHPRG